MWFGDIVSPEWFEYFFLLITLILNKLNYRWNDLWLNEGFARYMEYIGTDLVKPDWEMVCF